MGLENKPGPMEPSILVNGGKTELMEKGDSSMWMGTFMMVSGPMTRQMVSEFISTSMELNTKENGRMTCSMVRE